MVASASVRPRWRHLANLTIPIRMQEDWRTKPTMHELSIAMSIIEMAAEEAESRKVRVEAVYLKLGGLSGVVKVALLSCYEMACEGTPLQGSRLIIDEVPVAIFCAKCNAQHP